jgi:hypothetical protein
MEIDVKLLDKCPEVTDYEKDLIRHIDVNHESQSSVAKHYSKTPSTISIQHRKAVARFNEWAQNRQKQEKTARKEDFDKKVFHYFLKGLSPSQTIEKLGDPERIFELWKEHRKFMEDDYLKALRKLAEYSYEPSGNSYYPLSEELTLALKDMSQWVDMLNDEDEEVRAVLEEQGIKGGLAFGGYGPTSDGVKELAGKLFQTQSDLVSMGNQKENLRQKLERTQNILSATQKTLDNAQRKVERLQRLEKYENLSEEKRESLRLEIESAQGFATDIHNKVKELHALKKKLEEEVDYLRLNKDGVLDTLKQAQDNIKRDLEDSILEALGNLQLNDVMKLYRDALERKFYKTAIAQ